MRDEYRVSRRRCRFYPTGSSRRSGQSCVGPCQRADRRRGVPGKIRTGGRRLPTKNDREVTLSRIFGAVCQNGYVVRDIRTATVSCAREEQRVSSTSADTNSPANEHTIANLLSDRKGVARKCGGGSLWEGNQISPRLIGRLILGHGSEAA